MMERIGGLFTFMEIIMIMVIVKLGQPFKDLHLAQSFATAEVLINDVDEPSKKRVQSFRKRSNTCGFKLRWCALRLCCNTNCCTDKFKKTQKRNTEY